MSAPQHSCLAEVGPDLRILDHPHLGERGKKSLQEGGPVAVVGAGNLGHRVINGLAALGVPLVIIDNGLVEKENIGLQLFSADEVGLPKTEAVRRRLHTVRPSLKVRGYHQDVQRLGPGIFIGCRLLVGCLDNFSDRLWLSRTAAGLAVPYLDLAVDGTGLSLYGRVHGAHPAQGTACLACGWDENNWKEVGQEQGEPCALLLSKAPDSPPTLALPGLSDMVSGLGIIQAIRILAGFEQDRVLGREVRLNLSTGRFQEIVLEGDPHCRLSHQPWNIHVLQGPFSRVAVADVLQQAAAELAGEPQLAVPDNPLVLEAVCSPCRREFPLAFLRNTLPPCPACGGKMLPVNTSSRFWFGKEEVGGLLDRTWQELGLPPFGAIIARKNGIEKAYVFAEPV